ncbi:hypothetical protein GCM10027586_00600 [Kineococcus gypseus]|uniref:nuclear transport factor 2 family protein n=1 Tax=Kineococcus gypseus TaxID=1637102 RepID=UPI003D7EB999
MDDLLTAERRLQAAQLAADVDALEALLHPDVVGRGPDGSTFTKQDDLDSYRSGNLRIEAMVEQSVEVHDDGATGVTRTVLDVDAVQAGAAVSARVRYTRLWVRTAGGWQVLAAAFTPVTQ